MSDRCTFAAVSRTCRNTITRGSSISDSNLGAAGRVLQLPPKAPGTFDQSCWPVACLNGGTELLIDASDIGGGIVIINVSTCMYRLTAFVTFPFRRRPPLASIACCADTVTFSRSGKPRRWRARLFNHRKRLVSHEAHSAADRGRAMLMTPEDNVIIIGGPDGITASEVWLARTVALAGRICLAAQSSISSGAGVEVSRSAARHLHELNA